jgi:chaperone required for assembly of F1-ATPase
MKRFYKDVAVEQAAEGWQVTLDGRAIRTQGGAPQIVPNRALAGALADEWRRQHEELDPASFPVRDLADFAIDHVAGDRAGTAARLVHYAETDTLCYRADPDEPLYRRQLELWEPLIQAVEAAQGVRIERVSGIVHRPQPPETLARLRDMLESIDPFTLAALETVTKLAASLTVGLHALDPDADADVLFAAANCEQDWQAELWGWDWQAEEGRAHLLETFRQAVRFARLAGE